MTGHRFPPLGYWARVTLTIASVLALLAAAWSTRHILLLVIIALVLAVGLDPQVRGLQHRLHLSRPWSVATILLLTIAFILLFAFLAIPSIVSQAQQLAKQVPSYLDQLQRSSGFLGTIQAKYHLVQRLREITSQAPTLGSAQFGTIVGITGSIGGVIFSVLTITVLAIYFLLGLPRGRSTAATLLAGEHAERNIRILNESLERIGGYVSGNLFISAIAGALSYLALRIIGVPFAAALAVWVAVADLIPSVGATIGAVMCIILALFTSVGAAVAVAAYFIVYQRIENYLILPKVMNRSVDLSAPTVIIVLLIGASLAGLAGALLALPIAATLKVVLREVWLGAGTTHAAAPAPVHIPGDAPPPDPVA